MHDNALSGPVPFFLDLTFLQSLDVSENHLTGSFPLLQGLCSLSFFDVHSNHIKSVIQDIDGLPIQFFDAHDNLLTGFVPPLPYGIEVVRLDNNRISGSQPFIPPYLTPTQSTLCPNASLTFVADSGWDQATGLTPWYGTCNRPSNQIFSDGFDPET